MDKKSKTDIMRVKSWLFKGITLNLPYVIKVEQPKETWGIFGDSFAQLKENEYNWVKKFNHFPYEHSWISFMSNAFKVQCESYGISSASVPDIIETVLSCEKKYDRYIIFMTNPNRSNILSKEKLKASLCEKLKQFLSDKKAIICYWDKPHKIFDFGHTSFLCTEHLSNPNPNEYIKGKIFGDVKKNKIDVQWGYHHMSLRGNFLFFLRLQKAIKYVS